MMSLIIPVTDCDNEVYNDVNLSQEERGNYSAEDYNYGIVSYCKTLGLRGADLDREAFTQEQIESIAGSISFDVSKSLEKLIFQTLKIVKDNSQFILFLLDLSSPKLPADTQAWNRHRL